MDLLKKCSFTNYRLVLNDLPLASNVGIFENYCTTTALAVSRPLRQMLNHQVSELGGNLKVKTSYSYFRAKLQQRVRFYSLKRSSPLFDIGQKTKDIGHF